jgi:hypothetical protein
MDPITLAFAGAQAGMGIAKAFSGHSDATARARAINQQRVQQYRNQLALRDYNWKRDSGVYAQRVGQYNQQLGENQAAYNLATGDVQQQLNETFRQAQVGQFQRAQQLAAKGGAGAASGRTGSGLRSDLNPISQYMQGQGMMMDNLLRARYGAQRQNLGFRNQLISANRRAYAPVSIAPMMPLDVPKPIQQAGPGSAGLMLGIGSSLLSGVSTYASNVNAEGGVNKKSFGLEE